MEITLANTGEENYPDQFAKSDIRNAYLAAIAYFAGHPSACTDMEKLEIAGFRISEGVTLSIVQCEQHNLSMTASHVNGDKIYSVTWEGNGKITSEPERLSADRTA